MTASVLKRPIITEKSLRLANSGNTYTFEVEAKANKHQIKQAIEAIYEVTVIRVNTLTLNCFQKKTGRKRLPQTYGPVKKALVTLKKGDAIDLFDVYNE